MSYTTQAKIEQYKGRSLTASEVSLLTDLLPAVDTIIDEIVGGTFTADSADYFFDGGGSIVDLGAGMTTVTAVGYVDTAGNKSALDATEYIAKPINKERKSYIQIRNGKFIEGDSNVYVTGVTGAVPSEVVLASSIIASDLIDDKSGNATEEKIGDYSIKYSDVSDSSRGSVDKLLAPYRDIKI